MFHAINLLVQKVVGAALSSSGRPAHGVGGKFVKDGAVVCTAFNEEELRNDPTAHAEMVLIRTACGQWKTAELRGCTLYCTLQPYGMCAVACLWAGISRIVCGAGRNDVNAVYFESRHTNTVDFIRDAFRDDLQVDGEANPSSMHGRAPAPMARPIPLMSPRNNRPSASESVTRITRGCRHLRSKRDCLITRRR
jgi:tRNA(adenine34) deaminase